MTVFFEGFGVHDPAQPEKMYLAAYDSNRAQMTETGIGLGDLENLLKENLRSRNALLLFNVARDAGPG